MCGVTLRPPRALFAPSVLNGKDILLCEAEEMETRRKRRPLQVYCTEKEQDEIIRHAMMAGLSISEYLRKVGMGTPVVSQVDKEAVAKLAKVNADLGRAGGLLKMLLKREEAFAGYKGEQLKERTLSAVNEISELRSSLSKISETILKG